MTGPVSAFGDAALLCQVADTEEARHLAAVAVRRLDGVAEDVVVGFRSVLIVTRPESREECRRMVETLASEGGATGPDAPAVARTLELGVRFDGPDLEDVAGMLDCSPDHVVTLLTGAELEVAFLGFAPGFPYLVGLPPELASLPRRPTPRTSVAPGSVAVAAGFASVYPSATPGGWWLLGTTSVRLFDADRPPYALVRPGDHIRFVVAPGVTAATRGAMATAIGPGAAGEPAGAATDPAGRRLEVVEPGILTLVEDGGRRRVAGIGVPAAGPADRDAMTLANRLVGNPDDAAALEVTGRGPVLRMTGDAHVAVVGAAPEAIEVTVDGRPAGNGTVIPIGHGQRLSVGRVVRGLRAYVAVAGGLATPAVVGSRSTDVLTGLGPAALEAGDHLPLGPPPRPRGTLTWPRHPLGRRLGRAPNGPHGSAGSVPLRVVAGPHPSASEGWEALTTTSWTVAPSSNRVGLRLAADVGLPPPDSVLSTPMVTGAVQVPPDGMPIALLPDHATVGGYPVVATVIAVDLPRLGQLRPGDAVVFVPVGLPDADRAWSQRHHELARSVTGWYPTAAGT